MIWIYLQKFAKQGCGIPKKSESVFFRLAVRVDQEPRRFIKNAVPMQIAVDGFAQRASAIATVDAHCVYTFSMELVATPQSLLFRWGTDLKANGAFLFTSWPDK